MCGKRKHSSVAAARGASKGMHESVRIYFCKECKAYHSTQQRYDEGGGVSRRKRNIRRMRKELE